MTHSSTTPPNRRPTDAERQAALTALADSGQALTLEEYKAKSRRSFLFGSAGVVTAILGWRFVQNSPADGNIPAVLRGGLEFNEALWTSLYDEGRTVETFPVSAATPLRVNGRRGLLDTVDVDAWSLRVEDPRGRLLDELVLDDIITLGEEDLVVEHKCIEGWSNVTHWGGVPFARFAEPYLHRVGSPTYLAIESIDGGYYVGLDIESALHPQVYLGTRLDGQPLDADHGAPLRLVSPIHYGIKSIKQIGTIRFSDTRPRDFWAERGYDWYSQH